MYTAKYWIEGINSKYNENKKSCLEAKFNFRQETAPKNQNTIKNRISNKTQVNLKSYFENKGFIELTSTFSQAYANYSNGSKNKDIMINVGLFKLKFDLNVEAKGEVPRKEMFDLDALHYFILTGEIKE